MSHSDAERKMAAALFGAVSARQIPAPGGFEPDVAAMAPPYQWDRAVVAGFCTGCGTAFYLTRSQAEETARLAGIAPPVDWSEFYITVDGCEVCVAAPSIFKWVPLPKGPSATEEDV